jgi:hypothetical protein
MICFFFSVKMSFLKQLMMLVLVEVEELPVDFDSLSCFGSYPEQHADQQMMSYCGCSCY